MLFDTIDFQSVDKKEPTYKKVTNLNYFFELLISILLIF